MMKKYGLYIAAASAILLAEVAGEWIAGQAVTVESSAFLFPALCGAASVYLLQKLSCKQRVLPLAAGIVLTLFYQPSSASLSFWERLFAPAAAAGVIIFITSIFLLLDYIRTTLQKFRDIAAGKIPEADIDEEK